MHRLQFLSAVVIAFALLLLAAIPAASAPAPQAEAAITIETPSPGTVVGSPVVVTGRTTTVPANHTLAFRIVTTKGEELGSGTISVEPQADGSGTWKVWTLFKTPAEGGEVRFIVAVDGAQAEAPLMLAGDMSLRGTTWQLIALGAGFMPAPVLPGTRATAVFGADTTLSGFGGCNEYVTTYTTSDPRLSVFPISVGREVCGREITTQESQFINALQAAESYRIEGDLLLIVSTGQRILVFRAT